MNEPPHPSTLGEILDRTANLYRSRFVVFFGIAVIPLAVLLPCAGGMAFFFVWAGSSRSDPAVVGILAFAVIAGALLVALPSYIGATALGSAAMNHATARAFQDEKITIHDALKDAWRQGWSYIGLLVLQGLIIWAAPLAVWIGLVLFGSLAAALAQTAGMAASAGALIGLAAVPVVVALAAYCIWMALRLSLAFPVCVVERIGPIAALKRSSALSQGTRGRIFLLYLLGTALNYILLLAMAVPALIVMALIPGANSPERAQTTGIVMMFVMYGAGFAVQALTRPVYGIALMLFYYDQRIRQEGYDIEWMMQRAGLAPPTPQQPEALPWLPPIATHPLIPEADAPPDTELHLSTEPSPATSEEPQ